MRVIRTIVLILVAIGALAPLARPSDFNWHGRLAPGQSVEIKGVNGAIHAERSSGTEVTVEATKSGRHNDPNSVTVQAVPHGDGASDLENHGQREHLPLRRLLLAAAFDPA